MMPVLLILSGYALVPFLLVTMKILTERSSTRTEPGNLPAVEIV